MNLLTIEEETSLEFYTAYLNNTRALIAIFDRLIPRSDFIMLPGDEIVEKKHANIKILTAQMESADLSKRATRKWLGLGPNVFKVDYAELFEAYAEFKEPKPEEGETPAQPPPAAKGQPVTPVVTGNELTHEVEVLNTEQHKSIIKARNEYYAAYKTRFLDSIQAIMAKYDDLRKEENRFSIYWASNLAEITQKHF